MAGRPTKTEAERQPEPELDPRSDPGAPERTTADAIPELLMTLKPRLKTILARFRIPGQDAEDLLQDALLLLVRNRHHLRDPAAYLLSTLQYRCRMYWRQHRRRRQLGVDDRLLEQLAPALRPSGQEAAEVRSDLLRQLATLEPGARRLVLLRYALGYTIRETADQVGLTRDSVRQRARYARNQLARRLAEAGRPEESSPCPDAHDT